MSYSALVRAASRARLPPLFLRPALRPAPPRRPTTSATPASFISSSSRQRAGDPYDPNHEESFEEFTARYEKEFEGVEDVFELQRNLNNSFAYDLVPSPSVIIAALHAARRVNDFPTAVRIFEGIKNKVENKTQYEEYLRELHDVREELGIVLQETMYPNGPVGPPQRLE